WQAFLDWVEQSGDAFSIKGRVNIGAIPARHFWDVQWWKENWPEVVFPNPNGNPLIGMLDYGLAHLLQPILNFDPRPDARPSNAWWKGNTGEVGWLLLGYESFGLPSALLCCWQAQRPARALLGASPVDHLPLTFNKWAACCP